MSDTVVIRIKRELKEWLESQKVHPRETYGDVIERLLKWKSTKSK